MNDTIIAEKRLSFKKGMVLGLILGSLVSWANKSLLAYVLAQMTQIAQR